MVGTGMISFPGLGINNIQISKVAFTLFGVDFNWYGLIIGCAFALGLVVAVLLCKKIGEKVDDLLDAVIIATPFAIIGARVYYCIFMLDYYDSFVDMLKIWEGGLAIYGAIIAAVITVFVFCKIRKINPFGILDLAAPSLILAQAIGRWGNFINQEAFGTETTLPWGMQLIVGGKEIVVHPTFLYESLWNLAGFVLILALVFPKRRWKGEVFVFYAGWYGLGRAFIEGLRTDSLMWGNVRVSQILAILCFGAAAAVFVVKRVKIAKAKQERAAYVPQFESALEAASQQLETERDTIADGQAKAAEQQPDGAAEKADEQEKTQPAEAAAQENDEGEKGE